MKSTVSSVSAAGALIDVFTVSSISGESCFARACVCADIVCAVGRRMAAVGAHTFVHVSAGLSISRVSNFAGTGVAADRVLACCLRVAGGWVLLTLIHVFGNAYPISIIYVVRFTSTSIGSNCVRAS